MKTPGGVFFTVSDAKRVGTSGFRNINVLQLTNNVMRKGNSKGILSFVPKIWTLTKVEGQSAQKQHAVLVDFNVKILLPTSVPAPCR